MDVLSQLKIGDKLSIERYKKDTNLNEKNILNAQLIDLREKKIYISTPIYKGKRYFLSEGQNISIFFYRDAGVYQFYAKVIKQANIDITTFIARPISSLQRIQRRSYYRLPIVIEVVIEKKQNDKLVKLQCVTKDLSGGGIKAICNDELKEGENIKINFYLHKNNKITVDSRIVRVIKDVVTDHYELGIKFNKISQTNEDKIFAFIFEKQRLLRKKGLI